MENNSSDIQIVEKPDWVSWDEIHDVLWAAHAENRNNGVVMRYPSLTGEEIRQKVEGNGKMLCAFVDGKLVGTAAIITKKAYFWCGHGDYAYVCFASVLPEYNGKGIYKSLDISREELARSMGLDKMLGDTHEKNIHRLKIAEKAGYRFVDIKFYKDHFNVEMVKWLNGCPYSVSRCNYEFVKRKCIAKIRHVVGELIHKKVI